MRTYIYEKKNNIFRKICKKYGYKNYFSLKQLEFADNLGFLSSVGIDQRKDYRKQLVITIDGSDAKDLDDAVSVFRNDNGYLLTVHIADVSHYVKEDSILDLEARNRGNSVYLIDRVIPMFPEILSNDICSLNAGKDSLTVSVEIFFDFYGKLVDYYVYSGIVNVDYNFSYEQVQEILDGNLDDDLNNKDNDLACYFDMLFIMRDLALLLYRNRVSFGSIDLQIDELVVDLDSSSFPVNFFLRKRPFSYRIIEEFMLVANAVVAGFLDKKRTGLFRVHEKIISDKFKFFYKLMDSIGYSLDRSFLNKSNFTQKDIQAIILKFSREDKKLQKLINNFLLRTFSQAFYSVNNLGHFALAFEDYTHFTSPIRRYSDLIVHRFLKHYLGIMKVTRSFRNRKFISRIAQQISLTERMAIDAEREIIRAKAAVFMQDKIGVAFDSTVSGVTGFGIFVEIEPYGIEGLVRVVDLEGEYVFDYEKSTLYSKQFRNYYRIGMELRVTLIKVDVKKKFIDFVIC